MFFVSSNYTNISMLLLLLLFTFRNEMFLLEKGKFTQIQEENQVQ